MKCKNCSYWVENVPLDREKFSGWCFYYDRTFIEKHSEERCSLHDEVREVVLEEHSKEEEKVSA